ncbi:MAG: TldD/PmbA family protein [Methanomassiliicoccales archaeon]
MLQVMMERAMREALSEGADQVEVFGVSSRTLSVYLDDSALKNVEEKLDRGISVRLARGRRLGEASTTLRGRGDVERCVADALGGTRVSQPDPDFQGFPSGGGDLPGEPEPLDMGDLVESMDLLVSACHEEGPVKVPTGMLRAATVRSMVINSNGGETGQQGPLTYGHVTSMTTDGSRGEGVERFYFPSPEELDFASLGASLGRKAVDSGRAETFQGKEALPVFLPPHQLAEMLLHSVGFAVSGENVLYRRSPWTGKMGERIASRELTVMDDPTRPGMLSAPADDEGVPSSRKELIRDGELRSFLYDSYNAGKAGAEPTGNALRRSASASQGLYRNPVGISPMNLVLGPGEKGPEDLIGSFDRALLVERFSHPEINPITGGFALEVRCAHILEHGESTRTVRHALLVGNMYSALGNLAGVADDARMFGPTVVPTAGFHGMELVGLGPGEGDR